MASHLVAVPAAVAGNARFPLIGTYGAPDQRWPGCEDARRQREGAYIQFSQKAVFIHESSCRLVSWTITDRALDTVQSCHGRATVRQRFQIDGERLTYQGRSYYRCRL